MTHLDISYTMASNGEMCQSALIQYVHDWLSDENYDIPKESIIPVSGKWASLSQQLLKDDSKLNQARRELSFYKEMEEPGIGADAGKHMRLQDVAMELERASGLSVLKSRYVDCRFI